MENSDCVKASRKLRSTAVNSFSDRTEIGALYVGSEQVFFSNSLSLIKQQR
jgi:hypothetical protein